MLAFFALPALLGLGLILNLNDDDSDDDRPEDPPEPTDTSMDTLLVPDDVQSFHGSNDDDVIVARDEGGLSPGVAATIRLPEVITLTISPVAMAMM